MNKNNTELVEKVFNIEHEKAWLRATTTSRAEYERQLRELNKKIEKTVDKN